MKQNRKWIYIGILTVIMVAIGIITAEQTFHSQMNGQHTAFEDGEDSTQDKEDSAQISPEQNLETIVSQVIESQEIESQATETEAAETEIPEPEIIKITISAVGDLTFGRNQKASYRNSFDEYFDDYGVDYFLQNVVDIFAADDCTIGNLEGTLTDSTDILTPKLWNHKGRPEYVDILTRGSVEVVSLGNNHIMDYNEEGVKDTFETLENAGVAYAISGEWGDRYEIYETEKGIKIGFVSLNEHYEGDTVYPYLEDGLQQLREQGAHLVFALLHWGGDKTHVIEDAQYTMGRWCIDQGYDLVLGCHPHVLQGIENYNGKYIVYSMGNFCYGGNKNPSDKDSMIFQQTFTFVDGILQEDAKDIRAIPCRLSGSKEKNDYCPVILSGEDAEEVIGHLNKYSGEFGLSFDQEGYLQ